MDIARIRKTIAALQARTVANGFTEAEAVAAIDQAQRLMERHGVSLADVEASDLDDFESFVGVGERRRQVFEGILAGAVGAFCGVLPYVSRRSHPTYGNKVHGCFFGYRADVEMAAWLFGMLRETALRELKAAQAESRLARRGRAFAPRINRRDFLIGFVRRIDRRLEELVAQRSAGASGARALVVAKDAAVTDAARTVIGELGDARPVQPPRDFRSLRAGEEAGARAHISRPIEADGGQAFAALPSPARAVE